MNVKANYSSFKDVIKGIKLEFSDEQYVTLSPSTRTVIKNEMESIEKVINVRYIDEQVSYDNSVILNRNEINDLIKVLQELKYQIKE